MKKASESGKKKKVSRIRSLVSRVHILIAVVAIIECLILISFTTFSWIETSSSLIIRTGKRHYEDNTYSRIPIANALNYKFIPETTGDAADLNDYFSYSGESRTQNLYRFARASSADGKTFFFPKKNNLNSSATAYRRGDIIDSNVNYAHFDFVVSNTGTKKNNKLKFYFSDANVFSVTNGTGTVGETKRETIRDAMRISFQTGNGTPKIYAMSSGNSDTFTSSAVTAVDGTASNSVSITKIKSDQNQKLFTVGKNSGNNPVSIRIWLEDKALGNTITAADLAAVDININIQLAYADNDYDYIYFDDYTFSNGRREGTELVNLGGHITQDYDVSDNYRMYFVYQESSGGANRHFYPMTQDRNGSMDANCWVTCDQNGTPSSTVPDTSAQQYIAALTTADNSAALNYSYFAYGVYNISTLGVNVTSGPSSAPLYKWYLHGVKASTDGELRYSAYSTASAGNGGGIWAYTSPLELVYFRDLATAVTTTYNDENNFKYITSAVHSETDTEDTGVRSNVMYVNTSASTAVYNTASMFYEKSADDGKGLFKSYVPQTWLTDQYMNFIYCPGGTFLNPVITWTNSGVHASSSSGSYIYTALGYSQNAVLLSNGNATGVGTWNAIESKPICFSTELIDDLTDSAYRYQIGVDIYGAGTLQYYTLVPDESNIHYYAYIPIPGTNDHVLADYDAGDIVFRSYASVGGSLNGQWYGKVRNGSRTYYPVALSDSAANSGAPKGYWNISVIVDGTYEHFFWVPEVPALLNGGTAIPAHVLGNFYYNTVGHEGNPTYNDITPNVLDEYRWYVPLDSDTVAATPEYVYYKWEPYTGTVFKYSQKMSDGVYCVITEAPDNTDYNTAFPTEAP